MNFNIKTNYLYYKNIKICKIKILIIIMILIITLIISSYFVKKDNIIENMIDINYTPTIWNRNKCNYKMNKTFIEEFEKYGIQQHKNGWNLLLPCSYDDQNNEMKQMQIVKGAKYFIIDNADNIVAKEWLWKNIVNHYGLMKACTMMPKSYVLNSNDDIAQFFKDYQQNKIYILKKNIQRQEGLKITKDKNEIINGKYNQYILAQELLQNPYVINGRKTNMRFYVLVICYNGEINVFVHKNGFMYYTPQNFVVGSIETDTNITTGYIDRKIYEINPLTHEDLQKYLDNDKRKLYKIEQNIKNQGLKISQIYFTRIYNLIKEIFIAFVGNICVNSKFSHNIIFQLFGVDIAVDNELNPMIMEINKGPDMSAKDKRDSDLKHEIVRDILKKIGVIDEQKNGFINVLEVKNGVIL
jgi:hypothetical protein